MSQSGHLGSCRASLSQHALVFPFTTTSLRYINQHTVNFVSLLSCLFSHQLLHQQSQSTWLVSISVAWSHLKCVLLMSFVFVSTDPQILGSSHTDQDQDQDLSFTSPQPGLSLWSEWPQLQRSLQGCRAPLVVSTVLLHTSFFLKGINQVCLT